MNRSNIFHFAAITCKSPKCQRLRGCTFLLQEIGQGHDADAFKGYEGQEMPVAGNDDLRTGVPGAFQNPIVRLVRLV